MTVLRAVRIRQKGFQCSDRVVQISLVTRQDDGLCILQYLWRIKVHERLTDLRRTGRHDDSCATFERPHPSRKLVGDIEA